MEGTTVHDDSQLLLGDITFYTAALILAADVSLYNLTPEETAFFKAQIGIDDDDELRRHILEVQAKAYKVAPYPCIRRFAFLKSSISTFPVYEHVLKLGRERSDAVLLDIGCCFGVDSRKAAADGFPAENIISSDINNEFLKLGHELFKTTPATYGGHLLPGDVFDPAFLGIAELSEDISSASAIDLSSLESLNPLRGRIDAIYASKFFHCFTEDKQLHLAMALAGLLSAQPGSVIFGDQIGTREKGVVSTELFGTSYQTFCHSLQTWSSLWDGEVFPKGSVKVETDLYEVVVKEDRLLMMGWSVTKL